jgi:hypothetical protein
MYAVVELTSGRHVDVKSHLVCLCVVTREIMGERELGKGKVESEMGELDP